MSETENTEKEQSEAELRQTDKKDFTPLIVAAAVLISPMSRAKAL